MKHLPTITTTISFGYFTYLIIAIIFKFYFNAEIELPGLFITELRELILLSIGDWNPIAISAVEGALVAAMTILFFFLLKLLFLSTQRAVRNINNPLVESFFPITSALASIICTEFLVELFILT